MGRLRNVTVLFGLALTSGCVLPLTGVGSDASPPMDAGPRLDAAVVEAGAVCGDGVADPGEECDLSDLAGEDCASRGFLAGELACAGGCTFDTSMCTDCPAPCTTVGEERCLGNLRQTCRADTATCTRWMDGDDCAAMTLLCRASSGTSACFGGDGETCLGPLPVVSLPFRLAGTNFTMDFADDHSFAGMGCVTTSGDEVVLGANLMAGQTVRFRELGGLDAQLSVMQVCGDAEACLRSEARDDPGLTFTAPSDGIYSFAVEGRSSGNQDYEIVLEDAPPGNLCTDPIDGSVLPATVSGAVIDQEFTDDLALDPGSCLIGNGPQIVFARDLAMGETARVLERGGLATYLHVLSSCMEGATCLRSEDREQNGLSFTAPSAGTYYFVVEAVNTSGNRDFEAVLDAPPPGNLCTDPLPAGALPVRSMGTNIDLDFTNDHAFLGAGCLSGSGPEIVMARALARGDAIRMRELGRLDSRLHVLRATCDDVTVCLRSEDREAQGLTFTAPVDDVYYFVFEAASVSGNRDYEAVLDDPPPGNVCAAPVDATVLATTVSGANIDMDFSDEHTFTGAGCSGSDWTEVVLERLMMAGQTVRFSETAGLDVTLRVLDTCSDTGACLRDVTMESPGLSFTAPADGRYAFVAEGIGAGGSRAYSIVLEAVPTGQTCDDPRVVTGDVTLAGPTFAEFTNDHTFSGAGCISLTGAEVVIERALTAGQRVRFEELGSVDVALSVVRGTCSDTAACLVSQSLPETFDFTAPSTDTYSFIVEAQVSGTQSYDIRLTTL